MLSPLFKSILAALILVCYLPKSLAITLSAGDEDYVTSMDITEVDDGIISSLSGTDSDFNNITNNHIITTGNNGLESSAYGIRVSGDFNNISNNINGQIITTGSSGRGIDVDDNTIINNIGLINTKGSTSYAIYAGGDNNIVTNSGSIITEERSGHGIYFNGDDNVGINDGLINNASGYGVYLNGNNNNFTNNSNITTTQGSSAYGIYISAGSDLASNESYFSNVINEGNITSNSHGIYNKDAFVNITNNGNIVSNVDDTSRYGINNEGANAKISNYGVINSARYAFYNSNVASDAEFYNYGTLNGDVRLGPSSLYLFGGQLNGLVNGNDNQGNVIIGDGASFNIDFIQQDVFEELDSLTISSNSSFSANNELQASRIIIDDLASLNINLGANVTSDIYGVSDNVGNLNINQDFSSKYQIGKAANSLAQLNIASDVNFTYDNDIYVRDINLSGILDISNKPITIYGSINGSGGAKIKIGANLQNVTNNLMLQENDILDVAFEDDNIGNINILGDLNIKDGVILNIDSSQNSNFISNDSEFLLLRANNIGQSRIIDEENINVNNSNSNISGILRYSTKYIDNDLVLNIARLEDSEISSNNNVKKAYNYLNDLDENLDGYLLEFQTNLNDTQATQANDIIKEIMVFPHKASLEVILRNNQELLDNIGSNNFSKKQDNALFIKPISYKINQEIVGDDEAYGVNSLGFILGLSNKINDDLIVNYGLNYIRSDIKTKDDLKKNLISSIGLAFLLNNKFGSFEVNNSAALSFNFASQNRAIKSVGLDATSRYLAKSLMWQSEVRKNFLIFNDFVITPNISFNYSQIKLPKYSESGAYDLSLQVDNIDAKYLRSDFGLDLFYQEKLGQAFLQSDFKFSDINIKLSAKYGNFLQYDKPVLNANFIDQSHNFSNAISDYDDSQIMLDLTLELLNKDNIIFGLGTNVIMRDSYQSYGLNFNLAQRF